MANDKRKKRAKSIQKKSGMAYAAAINQLRKSEGPTREGPLYTEGGWGLIDRYRVALEPLKQDIGPYGDESEMVYPHLTESGKVRVTVVAWDDPAASQSLVAYWKRGLQKRLSIEDFEKLEAVDIRDFKSYAAEYAPPLDWSRYNVEHVAYNSDGLTEQCLLVADHSMEAELGSPLYDPKERYTTKFTRVARNPNYQPPATSSIRIPPNRDSLDEMVAAATVHVVPPQRVRSRAENARAPNVERFKSWRYINEYQGSWANSHEPEELEVCTKIRPFVLRTASGFRSPAFPLWVFTAADSADFWEGMDEDDISVWKKEVFYARHLDYYMGRIAHWFITGLWECGTGVWTGWWVNGKWTDSSDVSVEGLKCTAHKGKLTCNACGKSRL